MPLSNEDKLRLNVLGSQDVKAIRINESSMILHALTARGEAQIGLTPQGSHDSYLKAVRNFLSEKYLDMPGGYPTHLKRWTRMGFTTNTLEKMLLLGDPEAVVAIAYSNNVSHEIAEYAWWANQSPEIARKLLENEAVVAGTLSKELAQFLLEFLPFEENALATVDSVRLCLQGNLLSEAQKTDLWTRAKRKNPYFVGFMLAGPKAIPIDENTHPGLKDIESALTPLTAKRNVHAEIFQHFLEPAGRKWLRALTAALNKPGDPDVVIALFIAIGRYIPIPFPEKHGVHEIEEAHTRAALHCDGRNGPQELIELLDALPDKWHPKIKAMLVLAQLGENTLNPIFGGRDATGTVMRKHLKPLTKAINKAASALLD